MPPKKTTSATTSSKKKKGHSPAHQNTFAFAHNPKSKLTAKILASPNVGVCRRCHDKIEWRKRYRKYRPRTKPGRCNLCEKRNVVSAAYHTICADCAGGEVAREKIAGGEVKGDGVESPSGGSAPTVPAPDAPGIAAPLPRACAVCVREPALPDVEEEEERVEREVQAETERVERRLGRALRLREKKGLERRVRKLVEDGGEGKRRDDAEVGDDEGEEEDGGEEEAGEGEQEEEKEEGYLSSADESEGDGKQGEEKDDEDDPFLAAVGGADQLLTGEAYRQMLLEREREG